MEFSLSRKKHVFLWMEKEMGRKKKQTVGKREFIGKSKHAVRNISSAGHALCVCFLLRDE